MVQVRAKLTADDLWKLPDDGKRYELLDGEIVVSPAPRTKHQRIVLALTLLLVEAERAAFGRVYFAPCDVVLDQHNVVQPDVFFVASDRLSVVTEPNVQGAPDLVVEVLSPSNSNVDLGQKLKAYARFGVRFYWVVSPEAEIVRRFTLQEERFAEETVLRAGEALTCPLFPGIAVDTGALFVP